MHAESPSAAEWASIDWEEARRFLLERLRRIANRWDDSTIEDLCSEAVIRLMRALRREEARNLEALMNTIAQRTFYDFLEKRSETPIDPESPMIRMLPDAPVESHGKHPLDLLDLVVRHVFRENDLGCLRLYRAWRQRIPWKQVGEKQSPPVGEAAVRKRWSRCMKTMLPALERDPRYARIAEYAAEGA